VPLAVLHVGAETLPPEYRHALLIARQDGHVAWRGDALAAGALVELLRGAVD
jgi:hypothetical protein